MILVGVPEFIAFSMKYPGESRYQLSCQGSELMVGLGKMFCAKCGTGKYDMPQKLGDFYDLTGTCMVYHNKVDFSKILRKLCKEHQLIFDWKVTPKIEDELERRFPPLMIHLVDLIENTDIGADWPTFISQIISCLKIDSWALHTEKIREVLNNHEQMNNVLFNFTKNSDEFNLCKHQLNALNNN